MKFHHIWGVKQKNSPYMLRIIVSCAVKMANRETETDTRKGDRMDDQEKKICSIGGSVPMMQWETILF